MSQIELKQNLKLSQQLIMTPRLQLAIKMLAMNNIELSELINQQIIENPIIDADIIMNGNEENSNGNNNADNSAADIKKEFINDDIDNSIDNSNLENHNPENLSISENTQNLNNTDGINAINDYIVNYDEQLYDLSVNTNTDWKQDKNYIMENTIAGTETLYEFIMKQVRTGDFSDDEIKLAEYIAGNLNSDGFLRVSEDELKKYAGNLAPLLDNVLLKIRRLEPVGIATYDALSCLLSQADYFFPEDDVLKNIIKNYIKEVANGNYSRIAKAAGIPLDNIIESVNRLKSLTPKPAVNLESRDNNYIIPDLYVEKINDKYIVFMEDDYLPPIKINSYYKKILNGEIISNAVTKDYVEEKLKSAVWLIKSIKNRKETILKIAQLIIDKQHEFFEKGNGHLNPIILKTIADELNLHESTVSRATSNKYISTHLGIFELKSFFSNFSYGDISPNNIMSKIKHIVENEKNYGKIYSDNDIVNLLKTENIIIARRTIAKYREILNIPSSAKRKNYVI
ncbi:MAG: RNA polymerase factor sigma-54 [bacterium]